MDDDREQRWADLLRRANRGDDRAAALFLTEIAPSLRRLIAARNGGRADDIEDILQTTLAAIHEARAGWRESEPVSRWIYAIARHKSADARRRRRRQREAPFDGTELEVPDPGADDTTAAQDLDRLLSRLDATSRTIVRDLRLEGLTARETGRHVGLSPGTVRVRLHRALAHLTAAAAAEGAASGPAGPRRP